MGLFMQFSITKRNGVISLGWAMAAVLIIGGTPMIQQLFRPAEALTSADLEDLAPNTWTQVEVGGLNAPTGILAYSGMAYDQARKKLYVFGGGHWDYSGNEVWVFNTATQTWSRPSAPDPVPQTLCPAGFQSTYPGAVFSPSAESLANARPLTRHTYDTVELLGSTGELFVAGQYTYGEGTDCYCWGCNDTWTWNPDTDRWTYRNVAKRAVPQGVAGAAYDPVSGLMYVLDRQSVWTYAVSTDTWTQLSPSGTPPPTSIDFAVEYDSTRRALYRFGGSYPSTNQLSRYDIATNTWTNLTPTGDTPPQYDGIGLAYDSVNDKLIAFRGGLGTWVYNPVANTWTDANPAVEAPAADRVHGRLKYDPINNVTWLVTKASAGRIETWAYRYAGGGSTGDTQAPTASLTSPADGATVSGNVNLAATASDNVGVVGVSFTVDGTTVGAEDPASPFSMTWNSAGVANGSHVVRAVARDAAGNSTTSSPVTVTVQNDEPPPLPSGDTVSLTVREAAGVTRTNEPVTTGVPLPGGIQRDTWSLWDGATQVPVQITPMDGNANWMLLDFQTSLSGNATKTVELRNTAPSVSHASPIQKTESATQITLDTGPLELTLKKDAFNLFEAIGLNGSGIATGAGSNITLTNHNGTVFNANAAAPTSVTWEYDGPIRKTLRVDGPFTGWSGMGYTLRLTVYAGNSQAKLEFIIRNSLQVNQRHIHMNSARLIMGAGGTLVRSTGSGSVVSAGYPAGGLAYDLVTAADSSGNNGTVVADWSYYGGTILVDFANPGSTEMTRQLNAAKTPLLALTNARWFSDYGDFTTKQFGTLEDERQTYDNLGLSWNVSQEPQSAPAPDYRVGWENVDVHGDLENDDLWQNLLMFIRTDGQQPGYYHRARAWARYYQWEYAFRTDGFEYAWDGNFEPLPGVTRTNTSVGLTAADSSYLAANYNTGKQDTRGTNDFGGDHTFGFGLADWYHLTGEHPALDAMTDIAEAAWRTASRFTPGTADTAAFELRLWSRWLLLLQRQYEVAGGATWDARRTHAADLLRLSPAWDSNYGVYHKNLTEPSCSNVSDHYISPFQLIWAVWAHYRYFLDTNATWARDRVVQISNFVSQHGINPNTGLAGHKMWLDCQSAGDVYYESTNSGYTVSLADVLTIGARLDESQNKLDLARTALRNGMCAIYPSTAGTVCRFVNQEILSDNVYYRHNGYLHATNLTLRDSSGIDMITDTVAPAAVTDLQAQ